MIQFRNASIIGALGVAGITSTRILEQSSSRKEDSAKNISPLGVKTVQLFENHAWKNEAVPGEALAQVHQSKPSKSIAVNHLGIIKKQ